ncbi:uncharacterized protein LOC117191392 [Drosophila miranda]|uniref:uncharacterized protein LOC117191392 n=1 Tax=Drosophila miranda TaxID=7229 RepID=UPI00143F2663|nr:uncharacterized protein LOC117191392 [Drosophila miranda]
MELDADEAGPADHEGPRDSPPLFSRRPSRFRRENLWSPPPSKRRAAPCSPESAAKADEEAAPKSGVAEEPHTSDGDIYADMELDAPILPKSKRRPRRCTPKRGRRRPRQIFPRAPTARESQRQSRRHTPKRPTRRQRKALPLNGPPGLQKVETLRFNKRS